MKPVILKSSLFSRFPNLINGVSTLLVNEKSSHFKFNLSKNVGEDNKSVERNRKLFFNELKIREDEVVYQNQIHSSNYKYVIEAGFIKDNDALITDKEDLFLILNIADCIPIQIYDSKKNIIAAIHAGWRGTESKIVVKTFRILLNDFSTNPKDLFVYFGPSICKDCFEVDKDVAGQFSTKFVKNNHSKFLVDLRGINLQFIREAGVPFSNIQISKLCTFENPKLLHSYRRDKEKSGRMFAVIGMRKRCN